MHRIYLSIKFQTTEPTAPCVRRPDGTVAEGRATMRLVILEDYDLASEWAAKYVRNRILQFAPTADKPFVLGLPTGG